MKRMRFFLLSCFALTIATPASFAQFAVAPTPILPDPHIHGRESANVAPLTLWYPAPAWLWTDALAVGNGRLGAMLFGGVRSDRYQLNDITVWSGGPMPNADDRPDAYKALPAIREALKNGDYAAATKLVGGNLTSTGKGDSEYWPSYETLGDLNFDYQLPDGEITDYYRWLDIGSAVSGLEFKLDGVSYERETFSSAPGHAIVTHFTADHPGKISFTVRLSRVTAATTTPSGTDTLLMRGDSTFPAQPARPARPAVSPDRPWTARPAKPAQDTRPGNVTYEAQLRVKTVGGSVKAEGDHLVVEQADEATLILAAGTSYILDWNKGYKGDDPHAVVTAQITSRLGQIVCRAKERAYRGLSALLQPREVRSPRNTSREVAD